MPRKCVVCDHIQDSNNITLHKLPSKEQTRKAWIEFIKSQKGPSWEPEKSVFVCQQHFDMSSYQTSVLANPDRILLKVDAVPSILHVGTDNTNFYKEQYNEEQLIYTVEETNVEERDKGQVIHNIEERKEITEELTVPEVGNSPMNIVQLEHTASINIHPEYNNNNRQFEARQERSSFGNPVNENERQLCDTIQEIPTTRKRKQGHSIPEKRPRIGKPRFVGDIKLNDFTSVERAKEHWNIALKSIENLRKENKMLRRKCQRYETKIIDLKSLLSHLEQDKLISDDVGRMINASISGPGAELIKRILISSSNKKYPEELQSFAATLHFYSAKAYEYVRNNFMNCLPHPKTLSRWYKNVNGEPGISQQAIESIRIKCKDRRENNRPLYFNLTIDEMSIKEKVEYHGKECCGYVDIGTNVDSDDIPTARYALVFMLVSINDYWKIPIAYYLIHGLSSDERAAIINRCLEELHAIQANVVSITVDGAACNLSTFKKLGTSFDIDNVKSFFKHPSTGQNIYVILDVCHMLKLIRNCLAFKGFLVDNNNINIKWLYFIKLVELQEKEGLHLGTRLRRRHIMWEQEKMKVILAAQTFSLSVANAMTFCEEKLKNPDFVQSAATSCFCININNMFDISNSRNLFSKNSTKRCITRENFDSIKAQIHDFIIYLSSLRDGEGPILKSSRKTGFLGMIISLQSIIGIAETLFKDDNFRFLMTYKLSQDHIETFFSAIRSRGGFNNNPTAWEFKTAFKRLLVRADVRILHNANCQILDNTQILITSSLLKEQTEQIVTETETCLLDHDYCFDTEHNLSEYANEVIMYIAGFVSKSISKYLRCEKCQEQLTHVETLSSLQMLKCRGALTNASPDVIEVCVTTERILRSHEEYTKKKNGLSILCLKALENIKSNAFNTKDYINHILEQTYLEDHRQQLIKLIIKKYLLVRLNHIAMTINNAKERIRSLHSRLIIFKNQ